MKATTVNPETRIGPLLDEHPELEEILIALAPEFVRLKNPILRRTVARVATVAQAAKIGGLPVPDVVNALRRALGQEEGGNSCQHAPGTPDPEPDWVANVTPTAALNAEEILARGGTPVGETSTRIAAMAPGEVLRLSAPFYPAPLVDAMRGRGHEVFVRPAAAGAFEVLIRRGAV